MTEKLSWTDLRRALTERTGADEREATLFLNALAEQIKEALRTDKQVKINGLGTFRLQTVAPRKSVSVVSGESITIDSYNKVVFAPEIGIKELVENNPVEQPQETVNPLQKLGQQADEIIDILADLGQGPRANKQPAPEPEQTATNPIAEKEEEVSPAPAEETKEESVTPTDVVEQAEPAEPEQTSEPAKVQEEPQPAVIPPTPAQEQPQAPAPSKPKRKYHFLRDTLICTICILLLLLGGYFFLREQLASWVNSLSQKQTPVIEVVDTLAVPVATETDSTAVDFEPTDQQQADTAATVLPPVYTRFLATENIREGSRLSWLAYRYYGNKELWVFIYDANKEHLSDPNQIKTGTPIRIPELTTEQMDTSNIQTRALIEALKTAANAKTH